MASLVVEHIESKGPGSSGITLDDGSFFLLADQQVIELSLSEGGVADARLLFEAAAAWARERAWLKSIDLLSRRDHSIEELRKKLFDRDFDRDAAASAIDRLREAGYLDDRRFAEELIRTRLRRHPEGRSALASALAVKGVDRHIAEQALEQEATDDVLCAALEAAGHKLARSGRRGRRLIAALCRRGFSFSEVRNFVLSNYPDSAG